MPTNSRRASSAILTGVAFAALAQLGHAAGQADATAPESQQVALQTPRADTRAAPTSAPLTLHVEDASGNAVRLVHVPGVGWQYDKALRGADSALKKAALQTAVAPSTIAGDDDLPLTVFIDGPSGFTYVWNRSDGWKCVGRLVDESL